MIAVFTIASALFQWAIIGERSWAALWAWYKFYGYDGASPISVNGETQLLFFSGSIAIALLALTVLRHSHSLEPQSVSQKFITFGYWAGYAIIVGLIWWLILLASPLIVIIYP